MSPLSIDRQSNVQHRERQRIQSKRSANNTSKSANIRFRNFIRIALRIILIFATYIYLTPLAIFSFAGAVYWAIGIANPQLLAKLHPGSVGVLSDKNDPQQFMIESVLLFSGMGIASSLIIFFLRKLLKRLS